MYCNGPPAATPPGTTELTALPTSWEVATSSQRRVSVAIPIRSHTDMKLKSSSTAIAMNHRGRMADSSLYEPKTFTNAGQTK